MRKFTLSGDDCASLSESHITRFGGGVYKKGDVITSKIGTRIESYSRHASTLLTPMGAFSYMSANGGDLVNLRVGRYCSVAANVHLMTGRHPTTAVTSSPFLYGEFFFGDDFPADLRYSQRMSVDEFYGPVTAGNDVWIGTHCIIKGGVKIGHGAVVAGGAVVVKDVPNYAIVGGNPAKIIRYRFNEKLIEGLILSKWWEVSPQLLRLLPMHNPTDFLLAFDDAVERFGRKTFEATGVIVTANGIQRTNLKPAV